MHCARSGSLKLGPTRHPGRQAMVLISFLTIIKLLQAFSIVLIFGSRHFSIGKGLISIENILKDHYVQRLK